jgi:hypothetical protein
MVAFHDRRSAHVESVDDVLPGLPFNPGDTLGKHVIDGRYVVRGEKTETGREFVVHEVLPNGRVIEVDRTDRRYKANKATEGRAPTSVYDI